MTTPYLQSADASLTWLHDWSARLTAAEKDLGLDAGTLKLGNPIITGPDGAMVTDVEVNVAGTGVLFHLELTGLTPPQDITLTTSATLSNGDEDVCDLVIGIR